MQFLTAAGAILVALCALEGARRLNRGIDRNLSGVNAYLSLLHYVRSQIDQYALPLGEIFERCSRELLFACGWREERAPADFDELLAVCSIDDSDAERIIFEFCLGFGQNYREEELRRCDFAIEALGRCHRHLAGEAAKKKKLNITLCTCGAAALIILLI